MTYCLYIVYIIAVPSVCPSWTLPTIRSNVFVHYYALWVRVVSLEKNGVGEVGGGCCKELGGKGNVRFCSERTVLLLTKHPKKRAGKKKEGE